MENSFEIPLSPLPYPVYFVLKNRFDRWKDVASLKIPPSVDQFRDRISSASEAWTLYTYIQLKRRGLDVHLSPCYIQNKICITSYDDIRMKDYAYNSYVVVCRHDRPRPAICEQRIVQNYLNVLNDIDHFMTHWPSPGILPRDLKRDSRIELVVYKGLSKNLAYPFRSQKFLNKLAKMGINFEMSNDEDIISGKPSWWDYGHADVVLAIRNSTPYDLSIKPANKLVNAWLAGCPAILGPEPAYQRLRKSELDYTEVRNPNEALAAIKRLKDDPKYYKSVILNGFERTKEFSDDIISNEWRNLIAGPISKGYEHWLEEYGALQPYMRVIRFVYRSFKHKLEIRKFNIGIHTGERLFKDDA